MQEYLVYIPSVIAILTAIGIWLNVAAYKRQTELQLKQIAYGEGVKDEKLRALEEKVSEVGELTTVISSLNATVEALKDQTRTLDHTVKGLMMRAKS